MKRLVFLVISLGVIAAGMIAGTGGFMYARAAEAPSPEPPVKVDRSSGYMAIPVASAGASDRYGYTYDDAAAPVWIDASSGTEVEFSSLDDASAGPFAIGFTLNYYENGYAEFYISTNGMLSFGAETEAFDNRPLPRDTTPNNIIAPFWDDLTLLVSDTNQKISKVFYKQGSDAGGKYLAVEWYQVARLGSTDYLTFEVVLHENGDIVYQYQTLNGAINQATVGLEDEHGVDGLTYLFNADGLSTSKAIKFIRPKTAFARAKVFPVYLSDFVVRGRVSFNFTVRNTGNLGADTYDLVSGDGNPKFTVSYFSSDGVSPLQDTDGDGKVDTGSVAQGADKVIVVRVRSSSSVEIGNNIRQDISLVSSRNTSQSAKVFIQAAIPAPFVQAILNSNSGMQLLLNWKENQYNTNIAPGQFTGSNLSVVSLPDRNFLFAWEQNRHNDADVSIAELQFVHLNWFGYVTSDIKSLTDNSSVTDKTEDRFLSMSSLPDGRIGALWVRIVTKSFSEARATVEKRNENIFLAILDADGDLVTGPVNLTQNTAWRGRDDKNVPTFLSPRIAASADNRFMLAWVDDRDQDAGDESNVIVSIVNADGSQVMAPTAVTASQPGGIRYIAPVLVAVGNEKVVLAYVSLAPGELSGSDDDELRTHYMVRKNDGSVARAAEEIDGSMGSIPDGIRLVGGNVLLAWNVPGNSQVQYVVLDKTDFGILKALTIMDTPKGREPGTVSLAQDENGKGVLAWADAEQNDSLYYALVNTDGSVLTDPMIYNFGDYDGLIVNTNSYGVGVAPYEGAWRSFLPMSINGTSSQ